MDAHHRLLQRRQLFGIERRRQAGDQLAPIGAGEQFPLGGAVRIAELDPHQETVEL
ncbi:hypothetical protein GALL_381760 [mine drainage metagenome]|uniref:Uncharacterized protein n=1 Tax=mine drainage metagenome TaxID=410659 RepID=A0A1J5QJC8_9ZZZZ